LKRFVFFELRQEKKRSAWHLTKEAFLTADENETTSGERQGVSLRVNIAATSTTIFKTRNTPCRIAVLSEIKKCGIQ
jgi:hypothetical protein